jgi:hypothetical protein
MMRPRGTPPTQGDVEGKGAGGDGLHPRQCGVQAEAHDAPLAELFFDLAHGQVDGALAVVVRHVNPPEYVRCSVLKKVDLNFRNHSPQRTQRKPGKSF